MTAILDHARDTLLVGGHDLTETRDLQHGWQLRCSGGEVVCVYHTGKVVPQGKNVGAIKALFEANPVPKPGAVSRPETVALVETVKAEPEEPEAFVSRYPPDWSDTWALGDVPF